MKKDFQKCIKCLSKKKLVLYRYCLKLELDYIAGMSIFTKRQEKPNPQ